MNYKTHGSSCNSKKKNSSIQLSTGTDIILCLEFINMLQL